MQISHSGMQDFAGCQARRGFKITGKAIPAFRKAALVCGGAAHEAVKQLHEHPDLVIPELCDGMLNEAVMRGEKTPVNWGKGDPAVNRQKKLDAMIETVEAYWDRSSYVKLVSSERNFWFNFEHPNIDFPVMINGRLDQLRSSPAGEIEVWELKMGKTCPVKIDPEDKDGNFEYDDDGYLINAVVKAQALERDDQVVMQAMGFTEGWIALQDMDYVGPSDERYHEHNFIPIDDTGNIFFCEHCPHEFKFQKFNQGWPARVIRYHPYGHIPLKSGKRKGEARFPTRYALTWTKDELDLWRDKIAAQILVYDSCMRSGRWLPTGKTGFMGECDECEYSDQCPSKVCSVRVME